MCVSINKYGTGYRYIGEINNRLKIIGIYIYVHYTLNTMVEKGMQK